MAQPPDIIISEARLQQIALAALEHYGWNQGDAAHAIGMRRETLNRKLKAWGGQEGLRRLVAAQPSHSEQETQPSQPLRESQTSHVIPIHGRPDVAALPVPLNPSAAESSLTSEQTARRFIDVNAVTMERPEDSTVRIPPMSVDVDAEEDFFISQEVARGRLTPGGPRTRAAVVRKALRFYMESRPPRGEEGDKIDIPISAVFHHEKKDR